jgi:cytochrome c oxidase subunit 2
MHIAVALVVIALGSIIFHFLSPWWWTPIASNWGNIDTTVNITFLVTGIINVAILLFMAFCVYRYRAKEGRRAHYDPENKRLEWWLTIVTSIGVAVLLAPGLVVWNEYVSVPEGAAEFEVVGQQWQWMYRYPGADGVLGTTDVRNIGADNPFGIHLDDANGQDDILVEFDDVHLPVGKPVKVLLRSIDVLHDFYVPQIRAKMDMVPGTVTFFWFTPTRTGTFDVLCAELCGVGHYAMRGALVIEEEEDFQAWLAEQPTFAELRAEALKPSADEVAFEEWLERRPVFTRFSAWRQTGTGPVTDTESAGPGNAR